MVDNEGHEIFADKVGVMLARDISARHKNAMFVADVKSTGLFMTDPVLQANGAKALYWKTGHSYMKRYTFEQKALVGFEKSRPLLLPAAAGPRLRRRPRRCARRLRHARSRRRQDHGRPEERELPKTWQSPTMSPHCDDEKKYGIVDRSSRITRSAPRAGHSVAGQKIRDLVTVNGVRVVLEDGTWGLVRASSNKPELVVVVESPTSEANMKAIFADIDRELAKFPEVGEYNQKIVA